MKQHKDAEWLKFSAALMGVGLFGAAMEAAAYVGPGAGITLLGALWAVLLAIVMALSGLLIWPFRALRRRFRQREADASARIHRQLPREP